MTTAPSVIVQLPSPAAHDTASDVVDAARSLLAIAASRGADAVILPELGDALVDRPRAGEPHEIVVARRDPHRLRADPSLVEQTERGLALPWQHDRRHRARLARAAGCGAQPRRLGLNARLRYAGWPTATQEAA